MVFSTGPREAQHEATNSLVVVFPALPVIPITGPWNSDRKLFAMQARASTTFSTRM